MLQDYDNALPGEIKRTQQETYERNEFGGRKVTTPLWRCSNNSKKETYTPIATDVRKNKPISKRDRHIYAEDMEIRTTNVGEIYPEIAAFERVGAKHHIEINWNKIIILAIEKTKHPENSKNASREISMN